MPTGQDTRLLLLAQQTLVDETAQTFRSSSKMQTLQKFIATASFKKSSALQTQEPSSPSHVDVLPSKKTSEGYVNRQATAEVSEVKVRNDISVLRATAA